MTGVVLRNGQPGRDVRRRAGACLHGRHQHDLRGRRGPAAAATMGPLVQARGARDRRRRVVGARGCRRSADRRQRGDPRAPARGQVAVRSRRARTRGRRARPPRPGGTEAGAVGERRHGRRRGRLDRPVVALRLVRQLRSRTSPPRAAPSPSSSCSRPFSTPLRSSSLSASRSTSSCARMRARTSRGSSACSGEGCSGPIADAEADQLREVDRRPAGRLRDLLTAAEAVRDDHRVAFSGADRW